MGAALAMHSGVGSARDVLALERMIVTSERAGSKPSRVSQNEVAFGGELQVDAQSHCSKFPHSL